MAHSYNNKKIIFILLILFLFSGYSSWAHTINYTLEKTPTGNVIWFYLKLGIQHIIPFGIDHILFIVALAAIYIFKDWKKVLILVTAFTIGHSLTLALSVYDIIRVNSKLVEILIPCTIVITAAFNFFQKGFIRCHPKLLLRFR